MAVTTMYPENFKTVESIGKELTRLTGAWGVNGTNTPVMLDSYVYTDEGFTIGYYEGIKDNKVMIFDVEQYCMKGYTIDQLEELHVIFEG